MFKIISFLIFLVLLMSCNENSTDSNISKLEFRQVKSYFVGNNVEDGELFLLIDNIDDFNQIFHYFGSYLDTVTIYPSDFETKNVFAVIKPKSGYEWDFNVESIELENKTIKFNYNSQILDTFSFTMRVPLLVKAQKVDFNTLEFYENGKLVKTLEK